MIDPPTAPPGVLPHDDSSDPARPRLMRMATAPVGRSGLLLRMHSDVSGSDVSEVLPSPQLSPPTHCRLQVRRKSLQLFIDATVGHEHEVPLSPTGCRLTPRASPGEIELLNDLLLPEAAADSKHDPPEGVSRTLSSRLGLPSPHDHHSLTKCAIRKREEAMKLVAEMAQNHSARNQLPARRLTKNRAMTIQVASLRRGREVERPCAEGLRLEAARGVVARMSMEFTPKIAPEDDDVGFDMPLILFDWDDTLFPTEHIRKMIGFRGWTADGTAPPPISEDSPHYAALAAHAELLERVLAGARQVGRVAFVTLSVRPWVMTSAACFLPGINFDEIIKDLDIPIFYAREHVPRVAAQHMTVEGGVGVCPYTIAKRYAIKHCLASVYGKPTRPLHVISVGDSETERDAAWEVLWDLARPGPSESRKYHICKTVKFANEPTLEQLGNQLELLNSWLPRMLRYNEDFDLNMEDGEDLEFQSWTVILKD